MHEADVYPALVPVWEQVLHLYPDDMADVLQDDERVRPEQKAVPE